MPLVVRALDGHTGDPGSRLDHRIVERFYDRDLCTEGCRKVDGVRAREAVIPDQTAGVLRNEPIDIEDLDVSGKRIFLRVDFNVPLDEQKNITDDTRIRFALPTINYLLDEGASVLK